MEEKENQNWKDISKDSADVTKKVKDSPDDENIVDDLKESLVDSIQNTSKLLTTIIEKVDEKGGILSHNTATYTDDEVFYLFYGKSFNPKADQKTKYIKMRGRKVYEFALTNVPSAMKECLDMANTDISEVKKILIHQANA